MSTYEWAFQTPPSVPESLPPVHRATPGGLEGTLIDGVDWVLREVGLLTVLDRVTGDGDALHAAAGLWLAQATAVRATAARLRQEAVAVAGSWDGDASAAFGAFLGVCAGALDGLSANLAGTARILNEAGLAGGIAEDLVTGIVADAAEWAAAELAATLTADLLTFGLASVAGCLAESATMAVFVERATKVSADFGETLAELVEEMQGLKRARDAIRAAGGFGKLKGLRSARTALKDLELLGTAYRVLEATANAELGLATGLPLDQNGVKRLGAILGRTLGEEKDVAASAF
jgi:hypothetical protein